MKVSACVFTILVILSLNANSLAESEEQTLPKMVSVKTSKYTTYAEQGAEDWTKLFLKERYGLPGEMKYVFLPARNERDIDMLRIRYKVDSETITITQTICIFQITVELQDELKGKPSKDRCEAMAKEISSRVFHYGEDLILNADSYREGRCEGHGKLNKSSKQAPWLDDLRWWWNDGEVGFAFIKSRGTPSAMVKGYDLELNASWYSEIEKSKGGQSTSFSQP